MGIRWSTAQHPLGARQQLGSQAEQRAAQLLQHHGLVVVARNWRCRRGELDLVMCDAQTLVFVEVRSRSGASHGGAAASVDQRKRQRLTFAARAFLAQHAEYRTLPARFDVVAFEGNAEPVWLRAAFMCEG